MLQIPQKSATLATMNAMRNEEVAQMVTFIGEKIIASIEGGAVDPDDVVFHDSQIRITPEVSAQLTNLFQAKGWNLLVTNGIKGGSAIFLAH
jgi:hypothetical protein